MSRLASHPLFAYFRFGRDMNLIILSLVLANIGSHAEGRFFPLYLRELGATPTEVNFVVGTVAGLFVVLLSPVGGWATDRYRRLSLYVLGPLVGAVGEILMVVAPTWGWLVPGHLLSIFPGLLVGPALFGLVSDLGPPETRGSRFAYQAVGFGICATIGPLLGGVIYERLGYRAFMLLQAGMLGLASLVRSRIRDPREAVRLTAGYKAPSLLPGLRQAIALIFASRQLRLVFVISSIVGFGGAATGGLVSLFMSEVAHVSQAGMGMVFSLAGIASIAASVVAGIASDRLGKKPVLAVALFGMAIGFVWFAGSRTLAALGAVWLYQGFVGSLPGPAADALLADLTDPDSRGTVRSVFNGLVMLAVLPAPLLGGYLWELVSPAAPFWFAAVAAVAAGAGLVVWMKEPPRPGATGTARSADA
jgi:MFS family permease